MEFLVSALKQTNIIKQKTSREVIDSVVCSPDKEECMLGLCHVCKDLKIDFNCENDFKVKYWKWQTVTENRVIRNKVKIIKKTKKTKNTTNVSKLEMEFIKDLALFKQHVFYVK